MAKSFFDQDGIFVTDADGIVTLVSEVDTFRDRHVATENAYEGGAKELRNRLKVRYGAPYLRL